MVEQPALIQRFARNAAGRDYAVGDIHGCFSRLRLSLDEIGFDPVRDRLFSVGDLIDRGPECEQTLAWLDQPWFHAVRGNHEDYAVRYTSVDHANWVVNGGAWFLDLEPRAQERFSARLGLLPLAIEVETARGLVGLVHADCPASSWTGMTRALGASKSMRKMVMWSRSRIQSTDPRGVAGIRAVVAGHTPLPRPTALGNVYHIDTGGWYQDGGGYFTLLELDSLRAFPQPIAGQGDGAPPASQGGDTRESGATKSGR